MYKESAAGNGQPLVFIEVIAETLRDWFYLAKHGAVTEFFYAPVYRYVQKMNYYRGTKR